MFSYRHGAIAAASLLAGLGYIQVAHAGTLLAQATRPNNYTDTSTALVAVPLDASANTSLSFTTTARNELVRVIYNAECGVLGPPQSWLTVEVTIDGVQTNPKSGTSFALCTSTDASHYSWVGAVRQAVLRVPTPGSHTVQVLAAGENGVTTWWLGDTSLVVDH